MMFQALGRWVADLWWKAHFGDLDQPVPLVSVSFTPGTDQLTIIPNRHLDLAVVAALLRCTLTQIEERMAKP